MKSLSVPPSAKERIGFALADSALQKLALTFAVLCLLLLPQFGAAGQEKHWDKVVTKLMREGNVPGLSIAVIRDGRIYWEGAFGQKNAIRDGKTDGPVRPDTLFLAASLSKPVFAYIVLRLADRGVIDLDKPLYTYGLSYPRIEKDERYKLVTARMCLDHTSGLPNWGGTPLEFMFTPGTKYSYSGEGYVYLQQVVEHITGKPLNDLGHEEVFEPLKMVHSTFRWLPSLAGNLVTGKTEADYPLTWNYPYDNPASSLMTTAHDYALFVIALLNGGGLKAETFRQMWSPPNTVPGKEVPIGLDYGLGWGLEQTATAKYIDHTGNNVGWQSFVMANPSSRNGFVYFTNSEDGHTIESALVRSIEGLDHLQMVSGAEPYNSPRMVARNELRHAFMTEDLDTALARYRELRNSSSQIVDDEFSESLGLFLRNRKRMEGAITVYKENAQNYPKSVQAQDALSWAYVFANKIDLAISATETALALVPKSDRPEKIAWLKEFIQYRRKPLAVPPAKLREYIGAYEDRQIILKGTSLYLKEVSQRVTHRLLPISTDTFYVDDDATIKLQFRPKLDGKTFDLTVSRIPGW